MTRYALLIALLPTLVHGQSDAEKDFRKHLDRWMRARSVRSLWDARKEEWKASRVGKAYYDILPEETQDQIDEDSFIEAMRLPHSPEYGRWGSEPLVVEKDEWSITYLSVQRNTATVCLAFTNNRTSRNKDGSWHVWVKEGRNWVYPWRPHPNYVGVVSPRVGDALLDETAFQGISAAEFCRRYLAKHAEYSAENMTRSLRDQLQEQFMKDMATVDIHDVILVLDVRESEQAFYVEFRSGFLMGTLEIRTASADADFVSQLRRGSACLAKFKLRRISLATGPRNMHGLETVDAQRFEGQVAPLP